MPAHRDVCLRGHSRIGNVYGRKCATCEKSRQQRLRVAAGATPRAELPPCFPCGHSRAENTRKRRDDCAACHREKQAARYHREPERYRRAASDWQRRNRRRADERQHEWRERNAEHVRTYSRERHRLRLGRPDAESAEYLQIILRDPCSYCGQPMEQVDHIQPTARGGKAQHWSNFTPACGRCNRTKHAKSLLTFLLDRMSA